MYTGLWITYHGLNVIKYWMKFFSFPFPVLIYLLYGFLNFRNTILKIDWLYNIKHKLSIKIFGWFWTDCQNIFLFDLCKAIIFELLLHLFSPIWNPINALIKNLINFFYDSFWVYKFLLYNFCQSLRLH